MNSGNKSDEILHVYFDTNAIRSLDSRKEIPSLLSASKDGKFPMVISEPVIWEWSRQWYEALRGSLTPSNVRVSMVFAHFKKLFIDHNVRILPITDESKVMAEQYISDERTYFKEDNSNDVRDASVLSIAIEHLEQNSTIILCGDKDLKNEFEAQGYEVNDDTKNYVKELLNRIEITKIQIPLLSTVSVEEQRDALHQHLRDFIEQTDPEYYTDINTELMVLPASSDKLASKLEEMNNIDDEVKIRVLGYSQWFSPLDKERLYALLSQFSYEPELIDNNSERLCQEELLEETEHYLLPNTKNDDAREICEQAMALVMNEIIGLID